MSTAGRTTQVIRKRANKERLIVALRSIMRNHILRYEKSGIVYDLGDRVDGKAAVVKIIYMGRHGVTAQKVASERKYLHNAKQLHGCARTKDSQYYYLIMPYKGLPFSLTSLSIKRAEELMTEARARYKHECCLLLL